MCLCVICIYSMYLRLHRARGFAPRPRESQASLLRSCWVMLGVSIVICLGVSIYIYMYTCMYIFVYEQISNYIYIDICNLFTMQEHDRAAPLGRDAAVVPPGCLQGATDGIGIPRPQPQKFSNRTGVSDRI